MPSDSDPLLDAEDIQGNIIPGFSRPERYLVAYTSTDKNALQSVLAMLRPRLTRMSDALGHRDERKKAFVTKAMLPRRADLWVNLALSVNATNALGASGVLDLDDDENSFASGMRPGPVGDPFAPKLADGSPNPAARSNWKVGSPTKRIDLLLIFAHDEDVAVAAQPVVDRVSSLLGSQPVYSEVGRMLEGEAEHFGFRDGISQPGVRGKLLHDGNERLITTRYGVPSRQGIDFGRAGQPMVWPGQFLTGQPNGPGQNPALPPELTNGSFLVFRRLQQNVKAFYDDTEKLAGQLSATTGLPLSGSDLRTRIVGRFPSGAALMRHDHEPVQQEGFNEINYFDFGVALPAITLDDGTNITGASADPDPISGRRCPAWAHIRKVNPRGLGTDRGTAFETIGFQMLRRGIPFGPAYNHANQQDPENASERGLLFISYQSNIKNQFGSLNHGWMNNPKAPLGKGFDLLVGQKVPDTTGLYDSKEATFFGPVGNGSDNGTDFKAENQWVIPTGGAYLFAPSLAFIDKFAPPQVA